MPGTPAKLFEKMGGEETLRTRDAGDRGEAETAAYLERRGYVILARQWRCRGGELDLVAQSPEGTVCFVEVKLRGTGAIGLPREFVDAKKRVRLRRAAALWMAKQGEEPFARFDVAEVYEERGRLRVFYLENAF